MKILAIFIGYVIGLALFLVQGLLPTERIREVSDLTLALCAGLIAGTVNKLLNKFDFIKLTIGSILGYSSLFIFIGLIRASMNQAFSLYILLSVISAFVVGLVISYCILKYSCKRSKKV